MQLGHPIFHRAINPKRMRCSCGLSASLRASPSLHRARITPMTISLSSAASAESNLLLATSPPLQLFSSPVPESCQIRSLQVVRQIRIEVSHSSVSESKTSVARSSVSAFTASLIASVSSESASASFDSFENSFVQRLRSARVCQ